jgi:SAM-dependent methyltransferase
MKQNKYDEPEFFAQYSAMPRSLAGLDAAGEWPALKALMPSLEGAQVLDLGCGFGWHCRYARGAGAASVVGIDLSEKMLAKALEMTDDAAIEYRRMAIEDIDFTADSFDLVLSSLAFHYVERFEPVATKVWQCLKPGGTFLFSVEHPIFTASGAQDWHRDAAGQPLHWPVDRYFHEGRRRTSWLSADVVKYHRTVATYVDTLLDAGFRMERLVEPGPSAEALAAHPEWADEVRRPIFLILAAVKGADR